MSRYQLKEAHELVVDGKRYLFGVSTGAILGMDAPAARVVDFLKNRPGVSVQELAAHLESEGETGGTQEALEELVALEVVGSGGAGEWRGEGAEEPKGKGKIASLSACTPAPSHPCTSSSQPRLPFPVRSLVCHIARDCNLRCAYCYAEGGSYGQERALMDPEMTCRSVDFLLRHSGGNRRISFTFFGGEPLLNPQALRAAVQYGRAQEERWGKEIDFSLTTNATLLSEETVRFLSENRIGVTVSLDGPAAINDRMRTYPDGRGSYQSVLPQVRLLLDHHRTRPVAARVTVTRGVGDLGEIFGHLRGLGFSQVGFCPVSTRDARYALSLEDLSSFLEQLCHLAWRCISVRVPEAKGLQEPSFQGLESLEWAGKDLPASDSHPTRSGYNPEEAAGRPLPLSNLANLLRELHRGERRPYPCGAGLGLLGVGVDGEIYPCHRFAGSPDLSLGRIEQGLDLGRQTAFFQRVHSTKRAEKCLECWIRYLCAGGCYFESYVRHGDPFAPNLDYCRWLAEWIEEGLRLYVALAENRPGILMGLLED
ncbi:MAG: SPASM domain-containing protein [Nitrospinae bacterium]|nr:SPASM domain-containing protein [Nitrospinota bacterium]